MTYGLKHIKGVAQVKRGEQPTAGGFLGADGGGASWGDTADLVYTHVIGAHLAHALDFACGFVAYLLFFHGDWQAAYCQLELGWVSRVVAYHVLCGWALCGFWHWHTYSSGSEQMHPYKFNPRSQYEPDGGKVGMLTSSTGNLQREVMYTTLGWTQSALWQCLLSWLWASGRVPVIANFLDAPAYNAVCVWLIAYWREIHFYLCHRGMHPWWDRTKGLADGDVGAFLYRHFHSLHHKSYNPGPWSGLCMHPGEHFLYFSCAWLPPLLIPMHPMFFMYCLFHADVAPIAGHDGYDDPGGNGDFHWLHHAKFECNYGVPFPINIDKMFGTWVDYKEYKENKDAAAGAKAQQLMQQALQQEHGAQDDLKALAKPLL